MPAFRFRLQSLLQYRESRRDLCRQFLAQLLEQDAELVRRRDAFLAERAAVLEQMADLQSQSPISVDQVASRRYRAGQLAMDARRVELEREQLGQQIALCRQALVKADQGVKVLEQLAEKQQEEFLAHLERQEARAREEAWQAGRLIRDRQFLPADSSD